jgi:hypothetical protein
LLKRDGQPRRALAQLSCPMHPEGRRHLRQRPVEPDQIFGLALVEPGLFDLEQRPAHLIADDSVGSRQPP